MLSCRNRFDVLAQDCTLEDGINQMEQVTHALLTVDLDGVAVAHGGSRAESRSSKTPLDSDHESQTDDYKGAKRSSVSAGLPPVMLFHGMNKSQVQLVDHRSKPPTALDTSSSALHCTSAVTIHDEQKANLTGRTGSRQKSHAKHEGSGSSNTTVNTQQPKTSHVAHVLHCSKTNKTSEQTNDQGAVKSRTKLKLDLTTSASVTLSVASDVTKVVKRNLSRESPASPGAAPMKILARDINYPAITTTPNGTFWPWLIHQPFEIHCLRRPSLCTLVRATIAKPYRLCRKALGNPVVSFFVGLAASIILVPVERALFPEECARGASPN